MTAKHNDPEYRKNAALRRAQVKRAWKLGEPVACWRRGGPILPGQPFDVGHRDRNAGHALSNLWPEHRHATPGCCNGNRSDGGTIGANHTNTRRVAPTGATTWKL